MGRSLITRSVAVIDNIRVAPIRAWLIEPPDRRRGWIVGRCPGNSRAHLLDVGDAAGTAVHIHGIDPCVIDPGKHGLVCVALADKAHPGKALVAQAVFNLPVSHTTVLPEDTRPGRMNIGENPKTTRVLAKVQLKTERRSACGCAKHQDCKHGGSHHSAFFAQRG